MKTNLKMMLLLCLLLIASSTSRAQETRQNISVHDPVLIKQGDTFYIFCTGRGIRVWSSKDMQNWKPEKPVFETAPAWAVEAVPSFRNHIWAPDISYHDGKYYIYYSISAFGKNTSAIGVATNPTLDPNDPNFKWTDHGKVVQSYPVQSNWNAIDPNIITDKKGQAYMSWGSFWGGLQLAKLSKDRLSLAHKPEEFITIASTKKDPNAPNPPSIDNNPVDAGGNAIEAPFIFKKGKYYYLFASTDYCCKGVNSSYKMVVGRSKKITGPYLDQAGERMDRGGGTLLLKGDEKWHGVGHNAVYASGGKDYILFHGYDASDNGRAKLRIEELKWSKKGWPELAQKQ